jgi:hypothetical protein
MSKEDEHPTKSAGQHPGVDAGPKSWGPGLMFFLYFFCPQIWKKLVVVVRVGGGGWLPWDPSG